VDLYELPRSHSALHLPTYPLPPTPAASPFLLLSDDEVSISQFEAAGGSLSQSPAASAAEGAKTRAQIRERNPLKKLIGVKNPYAIDEERMKELLARRDSFLQKVNMDFITWADRGDMDSPSPQPLQHRPGTPQLGIPAHSELPSASSPDSPRHSSLKHPGMPKSSAEHHVGFSDTPTAQQLGTLRKQSAPEPWRVSKFEEFKPNQTRAHSLNADYFPPSKPVAEKPTPHPPAGNHLEPPSPHTSDIQRDHHRESLEAAAAEEPRLADAPQLESPIPSHPQTKVAAEKDAAIEGSHPPRPAEQPTTETESPSAPTVETSPSGDITPQPPDQTSREDDHHPLLPGPETLPGEGEDQGKEATAGDAEQLPLTEEEKARRRARYFEQPAKATAPGRRLTEGSQFGGGHPAPAPALPLWDVFFSRFSFGGNSLEIRNILFILNVFLVTLCVLAVAPFSYNASYSAAKATLEDATQRMTLTGVQRFQVPLDISSSVTQGLADLVRFGQLPDIQDEQFFRAEYNIVRRPAFNFHSVMVANELGYVSGILNSDHNRVRVVLANSTTLPGLRVYAMNSSCAALNLNASCPLVPPGSQKVTLPLFSVTEQPLFQRAIAAGGELTWGPPALPVLGQKLAIPGFVSASIGGVAHVFLVEVLLLSLSKILATPIHSLPDTSSRLLARALLMRAQPTSFVVEGDGNLVATSSELLFEVQNMTVGCSSDPSCVRVNALQSTDPVIRVVAETLTRRARNSWGSLPLLEDGTYNTTVSWGRRVLVVCVKMANLTGTPWYFVTASDLTAFFETYHTLDPIVTPIATVGLIVFALALSFYVTSDLAKTLQHVARQLGNIASLDMTLLPAEVPRTRFREVISISETMELMRLSLNSFSKYVPRDVVRVLQLLQREAVLGVDEVNLSILFSDVADFTSISESLKSADLVELLCLYLDEMTRIIINSRGVVDKFIGDAIMAFWNSPIKVPNHQLVACRAAVQSQERLRELHQSKFSSMNKYCRTLTGLFSVWCSMEGEEISPDSDENWRALRPGVGGQSGIKGQAALHLHRRQRQLCLQAGGAKQGLRHGNSDIRGHVPARTPSVPVSPGGFHHVEGARGAGADLRASWGQGKNQGPGC